MYECFHCKTPWESSLRQPAVKETCDQCGAYLHCCRNCRFHHKGYPNECYIPDTEKVADKKRANFCDEFEFRPANREKSPRGGTPDRLGKLWGDDADGAPSNPSEDAVKDWFGTSDKPKQGFDDLFDDT